MLVNLVFTKNSFPTGSPFLTHRLFAATPKHTRYRFKTYISDYHSFASDGNSARLIHFLQLFKLFWGRIPWEIAALSFFNLSKRRRCRRFVAIRTTLSSIVTFLLFSWRNYYVEWILRCLMNILFLFKLFCESIQSFRIRFFHNVLSILQKSKFYLLTIL